jgi:hypothetical protein
MGWLKAVTLVGLIGNNLRHLTHHYDYDELDTPYT